MYILDEAGNNLLTEAGGNLLDETVSPAIGPPIVNDWTATITPEPSDFNTYIRDTFNFLAAPPRMRVVQTAAQTLTGEGPISFQSVLEDTANGWNTITSTYIVGWAGWYSCSFTACANVAVGATTYLGLFYEVNGVPVPPTPTGYGYSEAGLNIWTWNLYDEFYLSAGDSITPQLAPPALGTTTSLTWPCAFEMIWISE